jgi:hypothetical protein
VKELEKKHSAKANYIRTCVLARELCLIIRTHRGVLEKQDVNNWCGFISGLCKKAGCEEAGALCAKAAEAVLESEEKYLRCANKVARNAAS